MILETDGTHRSYQAKPPRRTAEDSADPYGSKQQKLYVENRTVKEELKKLNITKSNIDTITCDIDQKTVNEKESVKPSYG